jgi:hypothetical protein
LIRLLRPKFIYIESHNNVEGDPEKAKILAKRVEMQNMCMGLIYIRFQVDLILDFLWSNFPDRAPWERVDYLVAKPRQKQSDNMELILP